ncbi:MAG: hypothetical protein LBB87_00210 [Nitrososphaerota archaeon]|nr:hypothetical protein [Nitrososphaerota archaeon]
MSVLILLSGFVLVSSYAVDIEEYLPRGIVRITPEGDVEGTDRLSRNGNVYTLMSDMVYSDVGSNFISIECDGVIFDGNEKTLRGANNGIAIVIYGSDITVKNTRIVNFGTGIEVGIHTEASNNRIVDNYFETRWWCISLRGDKQFVSGNTFNANNGNAIEFWTRDTTFVDNAFVNCGLSFNSYDVSNVVLNNRRVFTYREIC